MNLRKTFLAGAAVVTLALGASAAQADTLSNTPNGDNILPFGSPDTLTYGQTFTAPVSGTLDSFTLYLNGAIGGTLYGGVGVWNCGAAYLEGCGVSNTLFQSAEVAADHAGGYTFTPGIAVSSGNIYVAYLSVFGADNMGQRFTSMPLGNETPGINYFVFNNTSDPNNNPAWNYFLVTGDAQFTATFNAVPEPGTWALMIGGFGLAGAALRRRRAITA